MFLGSCHHQQCHCNSFILAPCSANHPHKSSSNCHCNSICCSFFHYPWTVAHVTKCCCSNFQWPFLLMTEVQIDNISLVPNITSVDDHFSFLKPNVFLLDFLVTRKLLSKSYFRSHKHCSNKGMYTFLLYQRKIFFMIEVLFSLGTLVELSVW